MNAPIRRKKTGLRGWRDGEAAPLLGAASLFLIGLLHEQLHADLKDFAVTLPVFAWLFAVMLWCAFNVVRAMPMHWHRC